MRPDELAQSLEYFLGRSPASGLGLVGALLIANPVAGGFTRSSYARKRLAELAALRERAAALPASALPVPVELRLTSGPGDAFGIARDWMRQISGPAQPEDGRRLIVSAGGDGTSHEVLSALMALPPAERRRFLVLRLPLGTGNDGSDGRELVAALGRLLGSCRIVPRPAILMTPAAAGRKAPIWSFNIASVGADAFICDMTNRLKTSFPGDSYRLWVDVASVFNDFFWPPRPMRVSAFDATGREVLSFERKCLLFAFGASGHREYGSNKPILPDDDNACFVEQMGLIGKLLRKGPIAAGRHRGLPEVELFSATRVEVGYGGPFLFQTDGEVTRLETEDFPIRLELLSDSWEGIEAAE